MIHERVKRYLRERGIKNKFIADQLGKSEPWMSAVLNGRTAMKAETLEAISGVLGVSPQVFFDENIFDKKTTPSSENEMAATSA